MKYMQPTVAGARWRTKPGRPPGKTMYEPLSAGPATNNRLTGFGYDAAGNMTSNGSATYMYDGENRVINTAGYTYIYDGDGRRVEKCITPNQNTPASCSGAPAGNGTIYPVSDDVARQETDLAGNFTEL